LSAVAGVTGAVDERLLSVEDVVRPEAGDVLSQVGFSMATDALAVFVVGAIVRPGGGPISNDGTEDEDTSCVPPEARFSAALEANGNNVALPGAADIPESGQRKLAVAFQTSARP
jgi:hypothetical protein